MAGRIEWVLALLLAFPAAAVGQELRVYLVTVGPGELSYERYGHNALLFVDPESGASAAFDWGRFDFDQPNFAGRFIKGDMLYSSGAGDGEETLAFYVRSRRRVELQELNLTEAQALSLLEACEIATLPENRDYRYDYFIANCSTKVRDVLDEALGGQIRQQLAGIPTGATWRGEAERHVADNWLLWYGFNVGLGRPSDDAIDAWEQCFLPADLRDWLRTVNVAGSDGQPVALIKTEILRSAGEMAAVPEIPPRRWWEVGLVGLVLAGTIVLLSRLRTDVPSRLAAGLWFFVAGFVGTFLLWIWAFSGHWAGHENQNILLASPLGLPLAVTVIAGRWRAVTRVLAGGHLAMCLAGVLLHFVPGWGQENAAVIALALPLNAVGAWIAWNATRNRRASAASNAPGGEPAGLRTT